MLLLLFIPKVSAEEGSVFSWCGIFGASLATSIHLDDGEMGAGTLSTFSQRELWSRLLIDCSAVYSWQRWLEKGVERGLKKALQRRRMCLLWKPGVREERRVGGAWFSIKDQYVGTGGVLLMICNYGASMSGGKSDVSSELGDTHLPIYPPTPPRGRVNQGEETQWGLSRKLWPQPPPWGHTPRVVAPFTRGFEPPFIRTIPASRGYIELMPQSTSAVV